MLDVLVTPGLWFFRAYSHFRSSKKVKKCVSKFSTVIGDRCVFVVPRKMHKVCLYIVPEEDKNGNLKNLKSLNRHCCQNGFKWGPPADINQKSYLSLFEKQFGCQGCNYKAVRHRNASEVSLFLRLYVTFFRQRFLILT